jgi:hypothetical protein
MFWKKIDILINGSPVYLSSDYRHVITWAELTLFQTWGSMQSWGAMAGIDGDTTPDFTEKNRQWEKRQKRWCTKEPESRGKVQHLYGYLPTDFQVWIACYPNKVN